MLEGWRFILFAVQLSTKPHQDRMYSNNKLKLNKVVRKIQYVSIRGWKVGEAILHYKKVLRQLLIAFVEEKTSCQPNVRWNTETKLALVILQGCLLVKGRLLISSLLCLSSDDSWFVPVENNVSVVFQVSCCLSSQP